MLSSARINATVAVKDLERAKEFYTKTLGLELILDEPQGVEFQCGAGTVLSVYPSSFAGTAQSTVAQWFVDDVEKEIEDLRGRGVTFEDYDMPGLKTENGIAELGQYRVAWFKDPDGNILALGQRP